MILCHCNVLNDQQIRAAIEHVGGAGPVTPNGIYKHLGCRPQCGQCRDHMMELIEHHVDRCSSGETGLHFIDAAE